MRDEYEFTKARANPYVLKTDVARVGMDLTRLRVDIKSDFVDLSKQLTRMQRWTMAAIVASIAALGVAQKLFS